MNLFVAKLSSATTSDELQEVFSVYGEVTSAKVIFDRETGNSKGFGFVEMPNVEEANNAIAALNESELDGKQIVVKEANPQKDDRRGGGGFNRGGGGFNRGGGDRRGGDRRGGGGSFNRGGDRDRRGGGDRDRKGGFERRGNERRGGGNHDYDGDDRW